MNELEAHKEWIRRQQDWTNQDTNGLVLYAGHMLSKDEFSWSCFIKQNGINKRLYGQTELECVEKMVAYIKEVQNNHKED